jgi:uncharacterized repeat protein (TIGR03803 family)
MRTTLIACFCGLGLLALPVPAFSQTFKVPRTFSGYPPPFAFGRPACVSNVLYVTTSGGGTSGWGTVFRITPDGSGYQVLKNFSTPSDDLHGASTNSDGAQPMAGLVAGGGILYGMTYTGGNYGKGTIYSLQTEGTGFTVLKDLNQNDGGVPYAELTLADDVLYGTTAAGGLSNKGTVFRLNSDGTEFAVLRSFALSDGALSLGGLALSGDTLYGTTYYGGAQISGQCSRYKLMV